MTTKITSEVGRLSAYATRRLLDLAAAVDAADAAISAADGTIDDGLHDDYAHACHALLDAVRDEANAIRAEVRHAYELTNHRTPAGAIRIADKYDAYADDLEVRRGMI